MTVATAAELHSDTSLAADIERLAQLAGVVLNEHTNQECLCVVCGCSFPCELAVLAEHNAALLR